jgi:hypothetical protein
MAPFTRRFDMRNISRKSFLGKIQDLDQQARSYFNVADVNRDIRNDGTEAIAEWTPARSIDQSVIDGVGADLAVAVKQINTGGKMANVTGASALGNLFRKHLADVKAQLAQAGEEMDGAMVELKSTASQATEMVKAVKAETADLKASLGLHSNAGPELDDK